MTVVSLDKIGVDPGNKDPVSWILGEFPGSYLLKPRPLSGSTPEEGIEFGGSTVSSEEAVALQRIYVAFNVGALATPEEVLEVMSSPFTGHKIHLTPTICASRDDLLNGAAQKSLPCGELVPAYAGLNAPTYIETGHESESKDVA